MIVDLESYHQEIIDFTRDLPAGLSNGIAAVTSAHLTFIGASGSQLSTECIQCAVKILRGLSNLQDLKVDVLSAVQHPAKRVGSVAVDATKLKDFIAKDVQERICYGLPQLSDEISEGFALPHHISVFAHIVFANNHHSTTNSALTNSGIASAELVWGRSVLSSEDEYQMLLDYICLKCPISWEYLNAGSPLPERKCLLEVKLSFRQALQATKRIAAAATLPGQVHTITLRRLERKCGATTILRQIALEYAREHEADLCLFLQHAFQWKSASGVEVGLLVRELKKILERLSGHLIIFSDWCTPDETFAKQLQNQFSVATFLVHWRYQSDGKTGPHVGDPTAEELDKIVDFSKKAIFPDFRLSNCSPSSEYQPELSVKSTGTRPLLWGLLSLLIAVQQGAKRASNSGHQNRFLAADLTKPIYDLISSVVKKLKFDGDTSNDKALIVDFAKLALAQACSKEILPVAMIPPRLHNLMRNGRFGELICSAHFSDRIEGPCQGFISPEIASLVAVNLFQSSTASVLDNINTSSMVSTLCEWFAPYIQKPTPDSQNYRLSHAFQKMIRGGEGEYGEGDDTYWNEWDDEATPRSQSVTDLVFELKQVTAEGERRKQLVPIYAHIVSIAPKNFHYVILLCKTLQNSKWCAQEDHERACVKISEVALPDHFLVHKGIYSRRVRWTINERLPLDRALVNRTLTLFEDARSVFKCEDNFLRHVGPYFQELHLLLSIVQPQAGLAYTERLSEEIDISDESALLVLDGSKVINIVTERTLACSERRNVLFTDYPITPHIADDDVIAVVSNKAGIFSCFGTSHTILIDHVRQQQQGRSRMLVLWNFFLKVVSDIDELQRRNLSKCKEYIRLNLLEWVHPHHLKNRSRPYFNASILNRLVGLCNELVESAATVEIRRAVLEEICIQFVSALELVGCACSESACSGTNCLDFDFHDLLLTRKPEKLIHLSLLSSEDYAVQADCLNYARITSFAEADAFYANLRAHASEWSKKQRSFMSAHYARAVEVAVALSGAANAQWQATASNFKFDELLCKPLEKSCGATTVLYCFYHHRLSDGCAVVVPVRALLRPFSQRCRAGLKQLYLRFLRRDSQLLIDSTDLSFHPDESWFHKQSLAASNTVRFVLLRGVGLRPSYDAESGEGDDTTSDFDVFLNLLRTTFPNNAKDLEKVLSENDLTSVKLLEELVLDEAELKSLGVNAAQRLALKSTLRELAKR